MRIPFIAAAVAFLMLWGGSALAWTHVARDDETLKELAALYYGNPAREIIIRAANGFMHPDDGSLLQGEQVEIPVVTYHSVAEGEDWFSLANRYLGSSKRAPFLAELNDQTAEANPTPGKIVKIPYQLLYIFAPDETLKSVTRLFMGKDYPPEWLRDYNLRKKKKFGRGDAILIPLIDVEFTAAAKKRIETLSSAKVSEEDKDAQIEAAAQIAKLREAYDRGRYLEIVSLGQALIGGTQLTNPQRVGVYKYLAFAYVAFDETGLARQAFENALELQPSMELSPITVSPKIMTVFQEVQTRLGVVPGTR